MNPHLKLWAAVVMQALQDLERHPKLTKANKNPTQAIQKARRERENAYFWFFKSKEKGPGSLAWICEHLDANIHYVRKLAIARYRGAKPNPSF